MEDEAEVVRGISEAGRDAVSRKPTVRIRAHNENQLEFKVSYFKNKTQKKQRYRAEFYLFIPTELHGRDLGQWLDDTWASSRLMTQSLTLLQLSTVFDAFSSPATSCIREKESQSWFVGVATELHKCRSAWGIWEQLGMRSNDGSTRGIESLRELPPLWDGLTSIRNAGASVRLGANYARLLRIREQLISSTREAAHGVRSLGMLFRSALSEDARQVSHDIKSWLDQWRRSQHRGGSRADETAVPPPRHAQPQPNPRADEKGASLANMVAAVSAFLDLASGSLKKLQFLGLQFGLDDPQSELVPVELHLAWRQVDEFCLLQYERSLAKIVEELDKVLEVQHVMGVLEEPDKVLEAQPVVGIVEGPDKGPEAHPVAGGAAAAAAAAAAGETRALEEPDRALEAPDGMGGGKKDAGIMAKGKGDGDSGSVAGMEKGANEEEEKNEGQEEQGEGEEEERQREPRDSHFSPTGEAAATVKMAEVETAASGGRVTNVTASSRPLSGGCTPGVAGRVAHGLAYAKSTQGSVLKGGPTGTPCERKRDDHDHKPMSSGEGCLISPMKDPHTSHRAGSDGMSHSSHGAAGSGEAGKRRRSWDGVIEEGKAVSRGSDREDQEDLEALSKSSNVVNQDRNHPCNRSYVRLKSQHCLSRRDLSQYFSTEGSGNDAWWRALEASGSGMRVYNVQPITENVPLSAVLRKLGGVGQVDKDDRESKDANPVSPQGGATGVGSQGRVAAAIARLRHGLRHFGRVSDESRKAAVIVDVEGGVIRDGGNEGRATDEVLLAAAEMELAASGHGGVRWKLANGDGGPGGAPPFLPTTKTMQTIRGQGPTPSPQSQRARLGWDSPSSHGSEGSSRGRWLGSEGSSRGRLLGSEGSSRGRWDRHNVPDGSVASRWPRGLAIQMDQGPTQKEMGAGTFPLGTDTSSARGHAPRVGAHANAPAPSGGHILVDIEVGGTQEGCGGEAGKLGADSGERNNMVRWRHNGSKHGMGAQGGHYSDAYSDRGVSEPLTPLVSMISSAGMVALGECGRPGGEGLMSEREGMPGASMEAMLLRDVRQSLARAAVASSQLRHECMYASALLVDQGDAAGAGVLINASERQVAREMDEERWTHHMHLLKNSLVSSLLLHVTAKRPSMVVADIVGMTMAALSMCVALLFYYYSQKVSKHEFAVPVIIIIVVGYIIKA
eukprot:jgi/Mesvir1/11666/Mv00062-RA.3